MNLTVFYTNTMYTCWVWSYSSLFSPGLSEDFRSQTTLGRAGRRANRASHSSSTSRGLAFVLDCRILPGYCWVRDYVVAMRRDFLVIETFRHSRSGVRVHSSWGKARWKTILASAPQFPGFGFYQIRIQTKLVLIRSGHQTPLDL